MELMDDLVEEAYQLCDKWNEQGQQFEKFVQQVQMSIRQEEELHRSTSILCNQQVNDIRSVIANLCEQVDVQQAQINDDRLDKEYAKQYQQLQEYRNDSQQSINEMQQQYRVLQDQIQQTQRALQEIREKTEGLEVWKKSREAQLKDQETLYSHIANIDWDYEAVEAGKVKGTIFLPKSQKRLEKFEFDDSEVNQVEIVNQIWAMMEQGYLE
eukprot:TRINITY_DN45972_c0_g1_i14.p1 TRINITY_DN45972_c0_g1~~TRINITY_DN45972_c0_g1_i14.p1  ORF type:complete len:212 (-),score=31.27 TRINITY_DN45972_c0_g1_i14:257-892(-)